MTATPETSPRIRRFPPPWRAERTPGGFRIMDANGVAVTWVYAADERTRSAGSWIALTEDEARRVAAGIARLPDLIKKAPG